MSKFYAWLLLVVSTVQWIGGHICFEVAYLMEVEVGMSEPEQAISSELFEETGIEAAVNILPEGNQVRTGADYGNYFAFSKTDSTGTVYFTIDYAPRTATWEQVAGHLPLDDESKAPKPLLVQWLFTAFFYQSLEFPQTIDSALALNQFHVDKMNGRSANSPITPPPDFI